MPLRVIRGWWFSVLPLIPHSRRGGRKALPFYSLHEELAEPASSLHPSQSASPRTTPARGAAGLGWPQKGGSMNQCDLLSPQNDMTLDDSHTATIQAHQILMWGNLQKHKIKDRTM